MQRTVQQRMVGRVVELVPGLLIDAVDERIRIEARRRDEREHIAGCRFDRDQCPAAARERLFGDLLQTDIDRQFKVVARRCLGARQRAHRPAAGGDFDFLKTGLAVQFRFVALLDADLADVVGALVVVRVEARIVVIRIAVVLIAGVVDAVLIALRNPPDVADHVCRSRPERILAEQARAHFHARKAEALCGEARDFVVGEAGADRQALEVLRVFLQLLEAAPVACVDRDHGGQIVDHVFERVVQLRRRDFQRVRRVVLGQHHAVTVGDDAAVRHDRRDRDAVFVGLQRVLAVVPDLQDQETETDQPEADEHEHARRRYAQAELRELLLSVLEFGHAILQKAA